MGVTAEQPAPDGWEIAVAMNAAIKGVLGAMGQSGHVCRTAIPVETDLDTGQGYEALLDQATAAVRDLLLPGDTVVIADKVLALAQNRIAPAELLTSPDPKTVDEPTRQAKATEWTERLGFPVTSLHLLIAEAYDSPEDGPAAAVGCLDHNAAAHDLARSIASEDGPVVDVIVSDTDTGIDVRRPLIGTLTLGATPLGATAGLNLYECMRCACAAEFVRGHDRGIPLVVCRPAARCANRPDMGLHRGYPGALDYGKEGALTHA
ncbi:hypothetical protein [Streptomyces sp. NPDC014685]|uniref:hypothetical protein n=1 Tax=Streptomyces sp. NPDC014685 TaxID=3364881 RepID=UPI0036FE4929